MIMGYSIRKSAKAVDINIATAFFWRHKILEAIKLYMGFGSVEDSSIFCTDSHKSYIKFAQDSGLDHKRIKTGHHKEGLFHIKHINALHSKLKKWIKDFNGISTKYLLNYHSITIII